MQKVLSTQVYNNYDSTSQHASHIAEGGATSWTAWTDMASSKPPRELLGLMFDFKPSAELPSCERQLRYQARQVRQMQEEEKQLKEKNSKNSMALPQEEQQSQVPLPAAPAGADDE